VVPLKTVLAVPFMPSRTSLKGKKPELVEFEALTAACCPKTVQNPARTTKAEICKKMYFIVKNINRSA